MSLTTVILIVLLILLGITIRALFSNDEWSNTQNFVKSKFAKKVLSNEEYLDDRVYCFQKFFVKVGLKAGEIVRCRGKCYKTFFGFAFFYQFYAWIFYLAILPGLIAPAIDSLVNLEIVAFLYVGGVIGVVYIIESFLFIITPIEEIDCNETKFFKKFFGGAEHKVD